MKIAEYNQMMNYLTRPKEPEYEQVAMAGAIKGGKKLVEGLIKKGKAPKTDVEKVRAQKQAFDKTEKELAKSGQIPVKQGEVLEDGTPDYEYYEEILNDGENDFVTGTETIEELESMVKERKDEMAYMYEQYKMGKLDPEPGDKSRARMTFLQRRKEEAEMTDDFRLFTPDEAAELDELETMYEYTDLREKLDSPRKMTDEDLKKLKEFDDSGYEDFMNEMNRIKKAEGGVIGEDGMFVGEDMGSRMGFAGIRYNLKSLGGDENQYIKTFNTKAGQKKYMVDFNRAGATSENLGMSKKKTLDANPENLKILRKYRDDINKKYNQVFEGQTKDPAIFKMKKPKDPKKPWRYKSPDGIKMFATEEQAKAAQKIYLEKQYKSAEKPVTKEEKVQIKKLKKQGLTYEEIGKKLNIGKTRVSKAIGELGLKSESGLRESEVLTDKNKEFVKKNYGKLKRQTIGNKLFPNESKSTAYSRAGYIISNLIEEGEIKPLVGADVDEVRKEQKYKDPEDLTAQEKIDKKIKTKRKKKIKQVGSDSFEERMKAFKREIGDVLEIPKVKTKTYDYVPIDLAHRADLDQLGKLKQQLKVGDLGADPSNLNRESIKKLEKKLEPLYKTQRKLFKKASTYEQIPKGIQQAIDKNNTAILNSFEALPEAQGRIIPLQLNPKTLEVYRGAEDITKQLGIGLIDAPAGDILKNSPEEITIKANYANQILNEAVDEGLIDRAEGEKKLNKFFKTERIEGPKLKSVIPGAESLGDFTQSIIDDVAKGRYGASALKALGVAGLGYGIYDTGVGFKEGVSAPELGARFFGLDPVYRFAQEQVSMTPEARQIYRDINREKAVEAEDVAGLGIFDLQPAKEVTEEEKQILETELEKIRQNRELLNQQRAQERAGLLNLIEGKINPNVVAYRSEFSTGGDPKDKKKTTPALDKPTIQIDPNAPTDPSRRDFMEKGAGLGALGVGLATGAVKFGPDAVKAVKKVPQYLKEEGMPDFFYKVVEAVKQFGEKQKYKTGILKEDDVYTYYNPKRREHITVEEGPEEVRIEFMGDDGNPSTIGVRKGIPDESTKGKTPPDEYFEFSENPYKDILDEVGGYDDLPKILEDVIDID